MQTWIRYPLYHFREDGMVDKEGDPEEYNPWKSPASYVQLINIGRMLPLGKGEMCAIRKWFEEYGPLEYGVFWSLDRFCNHAAMFATVFIALHSGASDATAMANLSHLMSDARQTLTRSQKGLFKRAWDCGSLLSMLAVMASEDLIVGVRIVQCANERCGRLFRATNTRQLYCSDKCQQREQARRHRRREKAKRIDKIAHSWGRRKDEASR